VSVGVRNLVVQLTAVVAAAGRAMTDGVSKLQKFKLAVTAVMDLLCTTVVLAIMTLLGNNAAGKQHTV
jgi:hypothetical protein